MAFELVITEEECAGCGNCIVACPVNSFNSVEVSCGKGSDTVLITSGGGSAHMHDASLCNGCGTCAAACPYGAIKIVGTAQEITELEVTSQDPRIMGEKKDAFEIIKEKAPLTVADLAREMEVDVKDALDLIYALKSDNKILEYGKKKGEYLYSTEKPEPPADEGDKKSARPKVDPEKVRLLREKLDKAIPTINKTVIRSFIERDQLEKAKDKLRQALED